jgi:hypothetical protein
MTPLLAEDEQIQVKVRVVYQTGWSGEFEEELKIKFM